MDIVGTVTAPARIGFRVALWGVRTAVDLLPIGGNGDEPRRPAEPAAPAETVARPAPPPPPPPPPEPVEPEPPEPAHVDEGATVVAEFAEDGAEDGAGAEVELAEPWEGYDRLHADELVERIRAASREELAAILLYERANRDRASVLEAADKQLRVLNAPS